MEQCKRGIWTQHVDESTGRTYYFNLVHQRSYWQLPEELQATVKKPLVDTLREWDPEMVEKQKNEVDLEEDELQRKKKREEVLLAAAAEEVKHASDVPNGLDARMALAAQKKKAEEMQRIAQQRQLTESETHNEYLKMVRALESKDKTSETSGKWLVR